jgi:hypothetical protein
MRRKFKEKERGEKAVYGRKGTGTKMRCREEKKLRVAV